MSSKSEIEWTDATWNPVRGCTKVSPGCKHCYAETFAERFRGVPRHPYEQGFDLRLVPDKLGDPLLWKQPRRVFVNSMSDLFHEDVPNEYIAAVFGVMACAPRHTFQVLTKRAERLPEWFRWVSKVRAEIIKTGKTPPEDLEVRYCIGQADKLNARDQLSAAQIRATNTGTYQPWPLPNVWLGVSVESPEYLHRLARLREAPAAVRFASFEPLLADLGDIGADVLAGLDWAIVGAERHHRARPMHDAWVRSLRDQCTDAGVAFFYKQQRVNRRMVSLPVLDGRQWAEFPEARA